MQRYIHAALASALLAGCGGEAIQGPARLSDVTSLRGGAVRAAPELTYTSLDVPDATLTTASGINARGDVVGLYRDANNRVHGFLLRDGAFTTIDVPFQGVVNTEARGISPDGDIVGTYRLAGERPVDIHGFLLTKHGEFIRADFPGHKNTIPQRISPDGTIYGCYHDDDTMGSMKGMAMGRRGTSNTAVTWPCPCPCRTSPASPRAPSASAKASSRIDLPAPVSPVSTPSPPRNVRSSASINTTLRMESRVSMGAAS